MSKLVKNELAQDLQNHKLTFSGTFMLRNSKFMKTSYAPETLSKKM